MKKVGVITWFSYDNYGSILQAYALQKTLKNHNYQSDLINYYPRNIRVNFFKRISNFSLIDRLIFKKENNIQNIKNIFEEFRKDEFTFSSYCRTLTDLYKLNDEYDSFICGSDQIWAPTLFDERYFLDFVYDDNKKISYAPSFGLPNIENEMVKKKISKLISNIKYLSVREMNGQKIINDICNKKAKLVLDPTLLLNKEEWESFCVDIKEKDYILCYFLTRNKSKIKLAKKMAKKFNKEVLLIPIDNKDYLEKNVKVLKKIGPKEFVSYIKNASLVITDSYHGSIFSLNLNIPFIVIKRFKDNALSQNSRIYSILKLMNLESRLYNDNIEYFYKNALDVSFNDSNKILLRERENSLTFLLDSLKESCCSKETYDGVTPLCTGCGVCSLTCPKKCISMRLSKDGFYNYEIDKKKCINCNLCKKVCGQCSRESIELKNLELYSCYSLDDNVLKKSSSGGMAYEIANYYLKKGYKIIGVTYDTQENIAKHIIVDNERDLYKLSGSKYLQSYTIDAFNEISKLDKAVIIGTPCQIASIDNYLKLKKRRDNFILVDLICHGVPSYNIWKKCINKFDNIKDVKFRNKTQGWKKKTLTINGKIIKNSKFMDFFSLGNLYNKSCYECNYRVSTCADIRLGDYWGEKFKKNTTGVSMTIIATQKGKYILNELKKNKRIFVEKQIIEDYNRNQQTVNSIIPVNYEFMLEDFNDDNTIIDELHKKYCKRQLRNNKIKEILWKVYIKIRRK
ncbi:MAG: polysaccharide pyruvyl transferase family protein [Bacilli bacterium]